MDRTDIEITCRCGASFVWTGAEQQFYADKGFSQAPKWCKPCRSERNRTRGFKTAKERAAEAAAARAKLEGAKPEEE